MSTRVKKTPRCTDPPKDQYPRAFLPLGQKHEVFIRERVIHTGLGLKHPSISHDPVRRAGQVRRNPCSWSPEASCNVFLLRATHSKFIDVKGWIPRNGQSERAADDGHALVVLFPHHNFDMHGVTSGKRTLIRCRKCSIPVSTRESDKHNAVLD